MKRILMCGAFGIGSAGDEAGLQVFVDLVRDFAQVSVLMRNPSLEYARRWGVAVYPKLEHATREEAAGRIFRGLNAADDPKPVEALLELLHEADLLVLGPGAFFNEHCRGVLRGALPEMYLLAWLAQWVGTPVMIFAASASRLRSPYAVRAAGWLLGMAEAVSFREEASVRVLRECGVRNTEAITVLPDPVLGMPHAPCPPPQQLAGRCKKPVLGLSVRSLRYQGEAIEERYRAGIREVLRRWSGTVLAIPQLVSSDGYPDDRSEAMAIAPQAVHVLADDLLPWETESCYELASRALVTRLHAAVFCYRLRVPFVALAYEPKVQGFVQSIGGKCLPVDADPDEIHQALQAAEALEPCGPVDLSGYRRMALEAAA